MLGYVIYTLQLFLFLLMASHLVSHFFRTRSNINCYKIMVSFTIKLRFVIGSWVVLEVTISTISFFGCFRVVSGATNA